MAAQSLQIAAARHLLGVLTSAELVRVADEALEQGVYSDSLGQLATTTDPVMADVGPLFQKALRELRISLPDEDQAIWLLLRHLIGRIADGSIPPREGVQSVIREVYYPANLHERTTKYVGDSHGIEQLLGNFYAYDDLEARPTEVSCAGKYGQEAIQELGRLIVREAKKWMDTYRIDSR
jgi:hypothetical protein